MNKYLIGWRSDLWIGDKANGGKNSGSNLGHSYQSNKIKSCNDESIKYLAGEQFFKVTDWYLFFII